MLKRPSIIHPNFQTYSIKIYSFQRIHPNPGPTSSQIASPGRKREKKDREEREEENTEAERE